MHANTSSTPTLCADDIANIDKIFCRLMRNDSCLFRGHADTTWKIQSSLGRRLGSNHRYREAVEAFDKEAAFFLKEEYPLTVSKRVFSMQHYGLPTKLLDWTTSPLAALYFAVTDDVFSTHLDDVDAGVQYKNGCVYVLQCHNNHPDMKTMNHDEVSELVANGSTQNPHYMPYIGKDDLDTFLTWIEDETYLKNPEKVAFHIHTPYVNSRMKNQCSQFIVRGNNEKTCLSEDILAAEFNQIERSWTLAKIEIESRYKKEIKRRLGIFGQDRSFLFPEKENVCCQLKKRYFSS